MEDLKKYKFKGFYFKIERDSKGDDRIKKVEAEFSIDDIMFVEQVPIAPESVRVDYYTTLNVLNLSEAEKVLKPYNEKPVFFRFMPATLSGMNPEKLELRRKRKPVYQGGADLLDAPIIWENPDHNILRQLPFVFLGKTSVFNRYTFPLEYSMTKVRTYVRIPYSVEREYRLRWVNKDWADTASSALQNHAGKKKRASYDLALRGMNETLRIMEDGEWKQQLFSDRHMHSKYFIKHIPRCWESFHLSKIKCIRWKCIDGIFYINLSFLIRQGIRDRTFAVKQEKSVRTIEDWMRKQLIDPRYFRKDNSYTYTARHPRSLTGVSH